MQQLTEPKKGVKIVERDVVRVITPGTVVEDSMLEERKNNYIMNMFLEEFVRTCSLEKTFQSDCPFLCIIWMVQLYLAPVSFYMANWKG